MPKLKIEILAGLKKLGSSQWNEAQKNNEVKNGSGRNPCKQTGSL